MEKTYFIYDNNKVGEEGASKAFLSSEGGGGSFLFTDKIITSKKISDSSDGSVKVVKSFTLDEVHKYISGYEYANVEKNDLNYELPDISIDHKKTIEQRINALRMKSMDVVAQFSHDYKVTPT